MVIQIASGTGTGPTKLAAFDVALHNAGVANYNLIRLSSIAPPKSTIVRHKDRMAKMDGNWGDRLYVVMADMRVDTPNSEAWAGIGWVQDAKTGRGLFVEHEGTNEHTIRRNIEASLKSLMKIRRVDFGQIHIEVVGITCTKEPVCALVVAVYQASSWRSGSRFTIPKLR